MTKFLVFSLFLTVSIPYGLCQCKRITAHTSLGSLYARRYQNTTKWQLVHVGDSVALGQFRIICANGSVSPIATCISGRTRDSFTWFPKSAESFRCCQPNSCSAPNFKCLNGACVCKLGWTGRYCREIVPVCKPCLNGGGCVTGNRCQCLPGWGGEQCETVVVPTNWMEIEELSWNSTQPPDNWNLHVSVREGDPFQNRVIERQWASTAISNPKWVQVNITLAVNNDDCCKVSTASINSAVFFVKRSSVAYGKDESDTIFGIKRQEYEGFGIFIDQHKKAVFMTIGDEDTSEGEYPGKHVDLLEPCWVGNVTVSEQFEVVVTINNDLLSFVFKDNSSEAVNCLSNFQLSKGQFSGPDWVIGVVGRRSHSYRAMGIESIATYFGPRQQLPTCSSDLFRTKNPALSKLNSVVRNRFMTVYCPVNYEACQIGAPRETDFRKTFAQCSGFFDGSLVAEVTCVPSRITCLPACKNGAQCHTTGLVHPTMACFCKSSKYQQPDCRFDSSYLPADCAVFLPFHLNSMLVNRNEPTKFIFADKSGSKENYFKGIKYGPKLLISPRDSVSPKSSSIRVTESEDSYIDIDFRSNFHVTSFVLLVKINSNSFRVPDNSVDLLTWTNRSINRRIVGVWIDSMGHFNFQFQNSNETNVRSRLTVDFDEWVLLELTFRNGSFNLTLPSQNVMEVFENGPLWKSRHVRFKTEWSASLGEKMKNATGRSNFLVACFAIFKRLLSVEELNKFGESCHFDHSETNETQATWKSRYQGVYEENDFRTVNNIIVTTTTPGPGYSARDIQAIHGHILIAEGRLRYKGQDFYLSTGRWPFQLNQIGSRFYQKTASFIIPVVEEIYRTAGFKNAKVEVTEFRPSGKDVLAEYRVATDHHSFRPYELNKVERIIRNVTETLANVYDQDWPSIADMKITRYEFITTRQLFSNGQSIFTMGLSLLFSMAVFDILLEVMVIAFQSVPMIA